MGLVISPESDLGKELSKWEQHRTRIVADDAMPGNPYVFREYPKALYQARLHPRSGQATCLMPAPDTLTCRDEKEFERLCNETDNWNAKAMRKVPHEEAERLAKGQGWAESPKAALEVFEKEQQEIARLAAEAAFQAQRMGEKARAELAEADASTSSHVVDVVGKKSGPKFVAPQDKF